MKNPDLAQNWDRQKEKLKHRFEILTENDLLFKDGEKNKMLEKLQVSLGITKEELSKIIKTL